MMIRSELPVTAGAKKPAMPTSRFARLRYFAAVWTERIICLQTLISIGNAWRPVWAGVLDASSGAATGPYHR